MVICGLANGAPSDVPHGVQAVGLQLARVALAHPPEVRQGPVRPEQAAVTLLRELGDADAVPVSPDMLGHNIHGHLGQIQIASHPRRSGNAGGVQNIQKDGLGQIPGRHPVGVQVVGQIDKHLVDAIGEDVLRRDVFQVDAGRFSCSNRYSGPFWAGPPGSPEPERGSPAPTGRAKRRR